MTDERPSTEVVCTLDGADAVQQRVDDWRRLLGAVVDRVPVEGGLRLTFGPGTPAADVAALAQAEVGCCAFLAFALTLDDRGMALEVRGPADGAAVVQDLFGAGET